MAVYRKDKIAVPFSMEDGMSLEEELRVQRYVVEESGWWRSTEAMLRVIDKVEYVVVSVGR